MAVPRGMKEWTHEIVLGVYLKVGRLFGFILFDREGAARRA
jgi:hypothetical protein